MKIKLHLHYQIILGYEFSSIGSDNFVITIEECLNHHSSSFQIQKYPKMKYEGPKEFRKFCQLLNKVDKEMEGNYVK